ncbi:diphthamide biosynthesis protein [Martensiomyces pterosporus]|nr:diphthamide biosynthesis protein [Martensiomyces pterosporus]
MSELRAPARIDDDGSAVIQRDVVASEKHAETSDQVVSIYEVERTAQVINEGGYKRVALQFPDDLLADSTAVSEELKARIGEGQVFILADTSYGSCCVDEVASEHYSADLVVHYGRTCLSLTSRIPVFYVFGREPLDVEDCVGRAGEQLGGRSVLLMYDVPYAYKAREVVEALEQSGKFERVVAGSITVSGRAYVPTRQPSEGIRPGRSFALAQGTSIGDYTILYIGGESPTLTNIMLTLRSQAVFSYDPQAQSLREETSKVNRHLNKRYFMVQKAKDADVIGIVVGTLAATRYLHVVEALKKLIRAAHKKLYVFVIGKLNVAKLANFAEIDVFVLVACPENSLVDSKEFYRPIVTPYELELALSRTKEWTGDYVTEFHEFLEQAERDQEEDQEASDLDEDRPHFSLVTGTYKQSKRFNDSKDRDQQQMKQLESEVGDMVLRNKNTEIAQYLGSAGAEFLQNRSFRGLGHDNSNDSDSNAEDNDEPMLAVEGRSGIARGYAHERDL